MPDEARALENEIAKQIAAEEARVRDLVEGTPAEPELTEGRTRRERTRGVATRRLGCAVRKLQEVATRNREWRQVARDASAGWERSQRLSWTLAMSAKRVAEQEARRFEQATVSREDLAQAGFVGLLEAARRFEPSKGIRFATYARWWVQAEVKDALNRSRLLRVPGNAEHQRQKLRRELEAQAARDEPISVQRAAAAVDIDVDTAQRLLALDRPRSLDATWGDDEDGRRGHEALADDATPRPDEVVADRERAARLTEALHTLEDRDAFVLRQRHGIGPGTDGARTLTDVGEELGVSAQRVRQLQKRGERRLREMLGAPSS